MLRPYTRPHPAQLHHVTPDFDAELFQQDLADGAAGDPRDRFARARPLQDVARVAAIVFERAREVGVAGTGAGHLTSPLRPGRVGFRRHDVLPMLPVAVPDEHGDGRAQRLAGAPAGEPFDLVGLHLYAGAAAASPPAPLPPAVGSPG